LLGRVVAAPPPGFTAVALVDATGRQASTPHLQLRVVATPPMTLEPPPWPDASESAGARSVTIGGDCPEWEAALRVDPIVRAFLDGIA
jgi:hypothetical protein